MTEGKMTLAQHLEELRRRIALALLGLAVAMVVALVFGREILQFIQTPYVKALGGRQDAQLVTLTLTGGFNTYMKVALIAGLVLASPWVFYQLWMFVSAGLYPHERRYVILAVPFSAVLFVGGAVFMLYVAAVPAMQFLCDVNAWLNLQPVITLSDYVDFVTDLMLAAGLVFQAPLVILTLSKMGLINMATLRKYRRHMIVVILAVAAVLTPPDLASQFMLAVPTYLLYEMGVLLAWLLVFRGQRPELEP